MKPLNEAESETELRLAAALSAIDGMRSREVRFAEAVPGVMSPVHRAVDADCRLVEFDGQPLFAKVWWPDLFSARDPEAVYAMTEAVSSVGLTPRPRFVSASVPAIVLDALGEGWRAATVGDLRDSAVFDRLLVAKASIRELPAFPIERDVFADVERLATTAPLLSAEEGVKFLERARQAGQAIAASGVDRKPAHADGVASNVFISDNGGLQLLDFDEAGNVDPLFDLALVLNETHFFDESVWLEALERENGQATAGGVARLKAYAFADDLRWALEGALMDATSPRQGV